MDQWRVKILLHGYYTLYKVDRSCYIINSESIMIQWEKSIGLN